MAPERNKYPFVESFRDRHGKLRLYFRRGKGARTPLPGPMGSPEFHDAYQRALAGDVVVQKARRVEHPPGSLGALIVDFKTDNRGYKKVRASTRRQYDAVLEKLRIAHGHRPVAGMTPGRIEKAFLVPLADKPGAALAVLKILRLLVKHAILHDWLKHDPTTGLDRPDLQEVRSWTDAEIEEFEARWPVGTKQRLAFALHLFLGQRRSDVCRMTEADIGAGTIRVVQQKTGAKLEILLHPELQAILDATPREHMILLATEYGKPFSVGGYGAWLRKAITAAGLPMDCKPHGLRKAAGRLLAEAGCTTHQIMAVLGHISLSEAERYTREADQKRLAAGAIINLAEHGANKRSQTAPKKFGNESEKDR